MVHVPLSAPFSNATPAHKHSHEHSGMMIWLLQGGGASIKQANILTVPMLPESLRSSQFNADRSRALVGATTPERAGRG